MRKFANSATPPHLFATPPKGGVWPPRSGLYKGADHTMHASRAAFIISGKAAPDAARRRHGELEITVSDFFR